MIPSMIRVGARIRYTYWLVPRPDGWDEGTIIDGPKLFGDTELWLLRSGYDGWWNPAGAAHIEEILA